MKRYETNKFDLANRPELYLEIINKISCFLIIKFGYELTKSKENASFFSN